MTTVAQIDRFLSNKRLAFVGVSRNPDDFSRQLFRDLEARGYDLVPVNLGGQEVEGKHCYSSVRDVNPPVQAALVMTPAKATEGVVRDCEAAGIQQVWLHRGVGQGSVSDGAVAYCNEHSIDVVAGFCPYMFFPDTGFVHRMHGFALKLSGRYPGKA